MASTTGAASATIAKITPSRISTFLPTWSVPMIWMSTALGASSLNTAPCGFLRSLRDGLPITMDIGFGSNRGAGPGLTKRLGASLPLTMAAGYARGDIGHGRQVPLWLLVRSTLPRWLRGLEDRISE